LPNSSVKTLANLARNLRNRRPLELELGDWLDRFYLAPTSEAFREEPMLLAGDLPNGAVADALLGAVAEHLARRYSLPIPAWTFEPQRFLRRPYFALEAAAFRATLLLESPMEFRSRNLFVTANALSRASEHSSLAHAAGAGLRRPQVQP
jgi:hypothetical protein